MSEAQLPARRVVREVLEEEREDDVTLHPPYRFAQEIVTAPCCRFISPSPDETPYMRVASLVEVVKCGLVWSTVVVGS